MANNINELLYISFAIHVACGFLNIYREIFETKLGSLGQSMRALELLCILGSFTLIIISLKLYFDYNTVILDNPGRKYLRKCLRDIEVMDEWSGSSI
jgi:hypothetical protein